MLVAGSYMAPPPPSQMRAGRGNNTKVMCWHKRVFHQPALSRQTPRFYKPCTCAWFTLCGWLHPVQPSVSWMSTPPSGTAASPGRLRPFWDPYFHVPAQCQSPQECKHSCHFITLGWHHGYERLMVSAWGEKIKLRHRTQNILFPPSIFKATLNLVWPWHVTRVFPLRLHGGWKVLPQRAASCSSWCRIIIVIRVELPWEYQLRKDSKRTFWVKRGWNQLYWVMLMWAANTCNDTAVLS